MLFVVVITNQCAATKNIIISSEIDILLKYLTVNMIYIIYNINNIYIFYVRVFSMFIIGMYGSHGQSGQHRQYHPSSSPSSNHVIAKAFMFAN